MSTSRPFHSRLFTVLRAAAGEARRLGRGQCGSVAVEAALVLPMLIGIGVIGADMQRVHTERIRVENAAGVLALNISAQSELTRPGLAQLASIAMQGHEPDQSLTILYVEPSGRIAWALKRGGADGLCDPASAGGIYTGPWPAPDRPTGAILDADAMPPDAITRPQIAVQACRDTRAIQLTYGLALPSVIETQGIYPAMSSEMALDEELLAESRANGLAYPEEQEP